MVHKYEIKQELLSILKTGSSDTNLTIIKITSKNKKDIHWKETNEFKYKGEMYDVVKIEKTDSKTTLYYCIADSKERELLADLENQINKNKTTKNGKVRTVKVVVKIIPKEEINLTDKHSILLLQNKKIYSHCLSFYNSVKMDIESPPPNLV
ncbi:hypothetical protein [Bizionia arctica]|uniref:Uncharacterized protein n=1 Tax=Bizionia arctica TaxID=1495645 RepID=A0A917GH00_9FLAO|nr:hypothetical protein [Bizionia arctica]GGG45807.1 hypothetical protein GCM10010976_16730 [Bizionia arctica]